MERLFTPIKIKNMTLKNRIVMPALHHLYTPDGVITDRFKKYYYERAKGGAGLIIIGGCRFDDFGGAPAMPDVSKESFVSDFKVFTDEMHRLGAKVGVQLYQSGRYAKQADVVGHREALAPSAVFSKFTRETPKEMTLEDIEYVIDMWAKAAKKVKDAGFDTVEILGSAGYLISQFLSPVTNLRTDEYGGSWENRTRFPKRVIKAVRAAVGDDYPVIVRIAGNDFVPGSNTNEQAVEFAKICEECGADMINVTGGWHETVVPQLPGEVPHGGFAYLAAAVKDAVSIPVLACNRFNIPEVAEDVLAMGMADLIGFSRPLVADPYLPQKLQNGQKDLIRSCIGCNQGCLARTFFARPVECTVNALAGREYQIELTPANQPKKNLVIGGGPAGLEAAIVLKQRGHDVVVWEKGSSLGGQALLAAVPPGKEDFLLFPKYQQNMLKELGIEVVFNKTATKNDIINAKFDNVIIATGASPITIDLPGNKNGVQVVTAQDILSGSVIPGKDVVIVGGGSVGCETAQYILEKSAISKELLMFLSVHEAETPEKIKQLLNTSRRNVTIVEMKKKIGEGFDLGTGWPVLKQLSRLKAKIFTLSTVKDISDGKVEIENAEGQKAQVKADTVILSVGYRSDNALYKELEGSVANLYLIGDAEKPGKILNAVQQATDLALKL